MNRTIRARIHETAVKRVTRIYAATLADIFAETLQNSRRAGATCVHIAVAGLPGRAAELRGPQFTVTVADDGAGIADPAVLLSFGENGWDDATVRREDAAGFGFASLARRNCTVSSRPRSPDGQVLPGWRVKLEPAHFLGEAEAQVHADDTAPYPWGTSISFEAAESVEAIRTAAENAARHYPLPVVFEDRIEAHTAGPEELPRRAFLDGAVHAEPWRGLVFGVFKGRRCGYNDPDLNFFGHTLPVRLPAVETVNGPTWSVLADCLPPGSVSACPGHRSGGPGGLRSGVDDCPDLELVLPARKEAVENVFLEEMREAARLAIYRAMAADPDPRPAFEDRARAREAGIEIPPPPAVLRPWQPCVADCSDWREPGKLAEVGPGSPGDALVVVCDPEPPEAQALRRAAERAGIAARLFEPDWRLAGYPWYDALDRVTDLSVRVAAGDEWMALDAYPLPEASGLPAAPLPARPAAIRIGLAVRPASGPPRILDVPADVVFAGEDRSWIDELMPLVTEDSALQPHELAALIRAAYFSPSDEGDSDSWETQRERFEEAALHLATRLLLSDDEACKTSIAEAVRRELVWLAPRDRTVDIRIRRPDVTVILDA